MPSIILKKNRSNFDAIQLSRRHAANILPLTLLIYCHHVNDKITTAVWREIGGTAFPELLVVANEESNTESAWLIFWLWTPDWHFRRKGVCSKVPGNINAVEISPGCPAT
jgi:hypothetical protein